MKKKIIIFSCVLGTAVVVGYRIQRIRAEGGLIVNNIARIQAEKGVPREYVEAKRTTDFLTEPLHVEHGRAFVSAGRVSRFAPGDRIKDSVASVISVSKSIDLDSGMFVVRVSPAISGDVFALKKYTGVFLPVDAVLPDGARVIARDNTRVVATGIKDGEMIEVR